jgi:hypothetical protein
MADALGDRPSGSRRDREPLVSARLQRRVYLFALERGFLDSMLDRVVVDPFTRLASRLTAFDAWLCGAVLPALHTAAIEAREDHDE